MPNHCLPFTALTLLFFPFMARGQSVAVSSTTSPPLPSATVIISSRTYIYLDHPPAAPTFSAEPSTRHSNCSLETTPLCPTCDGGFSTLSSPGDYTLGYNIECNTIVGGGVIYYEACNATSLRQCFEAGDLAANSSLTPTCKVFPDAVMWSNGTCLLGCIDGAVAEYQLPGWAYVSRRNINAVQPASQPASGGLREKKGCDVFTTSLCPACDLALSTDKKYGDLYIRCDTFQSNGAFYEDVNATNPGECLEACAALDCCDTGFLWGDVNTCLLHCNVSTESQVHAPGWTYVAAPDLVARRKSNGTIFNGSNNGEENARAGRTPDSPNIRRYCAPAIAKCPHCDGAILTDSRGVRYRMECDTAFDYSAVRGKKDQTLESCMEFCDSISSCRSANLGPDGVCKSILGANQPRDAKGVIGLKQVARPQSPPYRSPAPTRSSALSPSTSTTCSASNISCPACNGKRIKNDNGKQYTVGCGKHIFSETYYAPQRDLGPIGCIEVCDTYQGCKGATWWLGGNCQIATGEDAFPQGAPSKSYIAFLPFDPLYTPEPPQLSAFPTGTFTPDSTESTPSAATASPSCDPSAIKCPFCDGLSLRDGFNSSYRVQCNFQPRCDDITGLYGHSTQNDCMEHCDLGPTCFAAIYTDGRCDLCQGSLEGLVTYSSPDDYVVFVAQPFLDPVKPTITPGRPPNWSGQSVHSISLPGSTVSSRSRWIMTATAVSEGWSSSRTSRRITPVAWTVSKAPATDLIKTSSEVLAV